MNAEIWLASLLFSSFLNSSGASLGNGTTLNGLGIPTSIMESKATPQEACPKANLMLVLSPLANSRLHQFDKANHHGWRKKRNKIHKNSTYKIHLSIKYKMITDYKSILWVRIFSSYTKPINLE